VEGNVKNILVVDDEPVVMQVARFVLGREGYRVLEATSAEMAFALAESHQGTIDLLITNHVLHNYTGRDVAQRVRAIHPEMKVMHTSGHLRTTLEREGSLTPGAAFLQKPFQPQELAAAVRRLLAK
jgi:DNA-binding response OmpR family regulator